MNLSFSFLTLGHCPRLKNILKSYLIGTETHKMRKEGKKGLYSCLMFPFVGPGKGKTGISLWFVGWEILLSV